MPRSSKHKSSRHSSRDAREYSDSEKDSSLKDRRGKDENAAKASKDTENRKLDSKDGNDVRGSGNGEYSDEHASSKRPKEGGGGDRWNVGDDNRGEGSKKSKASGDSKRRRRDESVGVYGEGEEVKRSSGKGDGKHKDSLDRKESREGGAEKDRKFKKGRSDESVDYEEQRVSKHQFENIDSRKVDELRNPELDNQLERRMRKKRDDSGDGDKHQVDVGDGYDRHLSSRDDTTKDGRKKDDRRKDEKYRDRYREEMDRENKHRQDKQRDERPAKDHCSSRSDDKHASQEKKSLESRQRRTKLPASDQDHDLKSSRDRERRNDCNRVRAQDCDYDLDKDRDYDLDRDLDWDHDCDKDRYRYRHRDCDGLHVDDRSGKSKGVTKKRTLDDHDDYSDSKSSLVKGHYPDAEKRSLSSSRAHSDVDRGISQLRHRNANSEDPKSRDPVIEQRTKGSREGSSGVLERGTEYKLMEKPIKIDESLVGDLSTERSSSAKASPMGLVERSPSSSIERKYMNKSSVKQSLAIAESGRRNSIDARDFSTSDDRLGWELTLGKPPLLDGTSQVDSSYVRTGQGSNSSLIPPPPSFRAALDRPFMGPSEDDVRDSSNTRYRRSSDPGFGRMHGGNSWRAVSNWPSPVPNDFVPFPHGPAHGGFQTMMPSFTSQPLFGVRPSMEVNHAGIPYRITDADRFPGHLRPIGWQNLMDGTGPAHLHGWDNNNGVFRDDAHMFGSSDWDRNRHSTSSQGWESVSETWKEQNSDSKKDLPSPACKDESFPAPMDNGLADQAVQMSQDEHNHDEFHEKSPKTKLSRLISPAKAPLNSMPSPVLEKVPDTSTPSENTPFSSFYLSKLDISVDLVLPELYYQCMSALNLEKNASIDADASTELFLKNDSSAQQKYATALSRLSPFPAIDNSIFQRAIDLYKKQMMQQANVGKVDIILASCQVQADESVPIPTSKGSQITLSVSEGMEDVVMPTLGSRKVETPSPDKEHLEESNQTSNQKEQDHNHSHSLKIVMSSPSSIHENQEESVAGLCGKENEVTSDKVNLGVAEEFCPIATVENKSQLAPTLHDEVDNLNSKAKPSGFAHSADENVGIMVNPSIYEDGSPKACDALMPGSNESELLILSRIHHSPESTH